MLKRNDPKKSGKGNSQEAEDHSKFYIKIMPVLPSRAGAETSQFLHLVCAAGSPHKNLVPDPRTEWSSCSFPRCESASGESNNRW